MQITTRPAQIFRAIFQTIKDGRIDWYSDQKDEYDVEYTWFFKRPFTIFRRVEEHIGDKHSTTWQYTFYKRYLWQIEFRDYFSKKVDEADEYFAPSEDIS
jgi:hypothetical protein